MAELTLNHLGTFDRLCLGYPGKLYPMICLVTTGTVVLGGDSVLLRVFTGKNAEMNLFLRLLLVERKTAGGS